LGTLLVTRAAGAGARARGGIYFFTIYSVTIYFRLGCMSL